MFVFSLSNRVTNSSFVSKRLYRQEAKYPWPVTSWKDESKDFKKDESKDFKSDELEIQTMLLDLLRFEIQQ